MLSIQEQNKKTKRALAEDAGIPAELYFENILTRLQAKDLAICSCVFKLWYNTISKDSGFASTHFIQNQTSSNLVFNLINVMIPKDDWLMHYFFKLEKEYDDDEFLSYRHHMEFGYDYFHRQEIVGYCNGLTCLKAESKSNHKRGSISIVNPTRAESLTLYYVTPRYGDGWGLCDYLCHGFGFDSLSQTYKVVILFATPYSVRFDMFSTTASRSKANHQEIVCMVLTLGGGTNSWRKIVTSISQVSPPGPCPFPSPMLTKASLCTYRSATLCRGDLFWRITYTSAINKNDKVEMLLLFDIHNEKIQLIPLQTECSSLTPPTVPANEHQDSVVDHHLLEFKGYPCVARSEMVNRHHCNDQSSSGSCRCSVKVHLYTLKDKVNQLWNEVETFDVRFEEGVRPFCWDLDTTTTKRCPRTRMLSFSDQLLLYWFDGKCVIFYNLQTKHHKVVKCRGKWVHNIFENKKKKEHLVNGLCPGDYQLHAQVENILSLKTFLPKGATTEFYFWSEFVKTMRRGNSVAGWMSAARESVKVRCF